MCGPRGPVSDSKWRARPVDDGAAACLTTLPCVLIITRRSLSVLVFPAVSSLEMMNSSQEEQARCHSPTVDCQSAAHLLGQAETLVCEECPLDLDRSMGL